jgi:translation initiation factor IF-2
MASKSSTAKSGGAQRAESVSSDTAAVESSGSLPEEKAGALDLLAEKPRRVRRKSDASDVALPTIGKLPVRPVEVPVVAGPVEPAGPTLDELKDSALSLFDEDEVKAERKRKVDEARAVRALQSSQLLKPISKIVAAKEEAKAEAEARLFQQLHPTPPPVVEVIEPEVPVVTEEVEVGENESEDDEIIDPKVIHLKPPVIVKDLAERIGIKSFQIIKELMALDIFVNQNSAIEPDVAAKICENHGFIFEREKRKKGEGVHKVDEIVAAPPVPEPEPEVEKLKLRPPIITIMGHVDHGKTSLLDYIRKSKVAAGEAGGITQHLGAYAVEHEMSGEKKTIVFLDTPGHSAFSAMRARGANLTDIVVLVIAADDGMMPTTHEALAHARAAGVKIVVALNKCDLPRADVNKVKQQLQTNDLMPEDWGGTTSCVEISATKGTNVDQLLEIILLEAEMLELKSDPKAPVRAIAVESRVEAGKGPTATIIASTGTIKVGMPFICGQHWGKVRSLLNDRGEPIKSAGPSIPCEIVGFSGPPSVGDEVLEMKSERDAKKLSEERSSSQRLEKLAHPRRNRMEDLFASMDTKVKILRIILKGDAAGSVEAIVGALKDIKSEKVTLDFAATSAGAITENDVLLASATDAIIVGFNTKVETKGVAAAKREGIQIKLYSIIYELIDQVRDAMLGLLDPLTRERIIGHALVKQVFKVQRGYAAGCGVTDGRVTRTAHARVMRGGTPVYDGKMSTLRRYNDEVQEVRNGLECGIKLGSFDDYEEGDIIECYELEKMAQTL